MTKPHLKRNMFLKIQKSPHVRSKNSEVELMLTIFQPDTIVKESLEVVNKTYFVCPGIFICKTLNTCRKRSNSASTKAGIICANPMAEQARAKIAIEDVAEI